MGVFVPHESRLTGPPSPPNAEFLSYKNRYKGSGNPNGRVSGRLGDTFLDEPTGQEWQKTSGDLLKTGWVPEGDSESLIIATGSTTGRSIADRFSDPVNVRDFGAVGDGVTDDTAAILLACASVLTTGGTVYFPRGTYSTDALDLRSYRNVTVLGSGAYSEFQYKVTSVIKIRSVCSTGIQLADDDEEIPTNVATGIVIQNLCIDANDLAQTGVNACRAVKLINVKVTNAIGSGIVIEGGSYPVHLDHVVSQGNGGNGLTIKAPFTTIYTVSNSEFGFNGGHGIEIQDGSTAIFENVLCQSNSGHGWYIHFEDGAALGFSYAIFLERLTFIGCYSEANLGWGLYVNSYNTNPATFVGKITDLSFLNCSFNSGIAQQVFIRGTTTPTIIGSPYIGAALDPLYNTIAVQTYTVYGKQTVKSLQTLEGNQTIAGTSAVTGTQSVTGVQTLGSNSIVNGRQVVGGSAVDASAIRRVISDGIPDQFERATLNTWQHRHTGGDVENGSGNAGFGIYNETLGKWGVLFTHNGTIEYPDKTIIAKIIDYQILAGDNGLRFTNRGSVGTITLTLPVSAVRMHFYFEVYAAQTLIIAATTGETIRDGATVSATGGNIQSNAKGCTLHLYCSQAGEWFVDQLRGTWVGPA